MGTNAAPVCARNDDHVPGGHIHWDLPGQTVIVSCISAEAIAHLDDFDWGED